MRLQPFTQRRTGAALLLAAVTLAVVGIYAGSVTWNLLAGRRLVNHRERQVQAEALARAGIERSAAHLLANPNAVKDETIELFPDSQLHIVIRPESGKENVYHVTSEARVPKDGPEFVRRSFTRTFRRTPSDKGARIEVIADAAGQP
jgi:hypothetical protein